MGFSVSLKHILILSGKFCDYVDHVCEGKISVGILINKLKWMWSIGI